MEATTTLSFYIAISGLFCIQIETSDPDDGGGFVRYLPKFRMPIGATTALQMRKDYGNYI